MFDFNSVPPEHRCVQTEAGQFRNWPVGDCFFGIPSDEQYGRRPLSEIPDEATGFHFYLGSDQQTLLDAYVNSSWTASTQRLHLGSSCYRLGAGRDYSDLTQTLLRVDFPRLELLELGVWQLFSNSHGACGTIGCLDALSARMPRLKQLLLYGRCQLTSSLSLPCLERLHLITDDPVTGMNDGAIDVATVKHLLASSFPSLQELYVDLDIGEDDKVYAIPDSLVTGAPFPQLTQCELVGPFASGTRQRLQTAPWTSKQSLKLHLDDIRETDG